MKGAMWRFPETNESTDILHLQKLADIDTIPYGADLKTIAYHPTDSKKACSVVDNNFVLWDLASETPKVRSPFRLHERAISLKSFFSRVSMLLSKLNIIYFSLDSGCGIGYFNRQGSAAIHERQMESSQRRQSVRNIKREQCTRMGLQKSSQRSVVYFIRAFANYQAIIRCEKLRLSLIPRFQCVKHLDSFSRDLDFNANRQYFLSTCGDDGYMKFWDIRLPTEPVLSRMEHSHWVWNIRINRFHDQLVLTSSSDSRVILCNIASISSEPFGHIVSAEDESTQNEDSCSKKK